MQSVFVLIFPYQFLFLEKGLLTVKSGNKIGHLNAPLARGAGI